MTNWRHNVKISHLFTKNDDHESLQKSMNDIADVLQKEPCFFRFNCSKFRKLPVGDDIISPADYANRLVQRMYDYADQNSIWIE